MRCIQNKREIKTIGIKTCYKDSEIRLKLKDHL